MGEIRKGEYEFTEHTEREWTEYKLWLRSMPILPEDKRVALQTAADRERRTLKKKDYLEIGLLNYPGI